MRCKILTSLLVILALVISPLAFAQEKRKPLKIEGMKVLPLRVLTRPYSNIYQEPDGSSPTVQENLPAFQPLYVYTRPSEEALATGSGWYEVGSNVRGQVLGWMKGQDVFEWKQTMCLAYTHPDGRKPVLMFDGKETLLGLVNQAPEERSAKAQEFYTAIDQKQITPDFPVKSVEPKQAVDISKQFYLLPILNHEVIELDGREGRLLHLAAVTGAGPKARESSDIRKNKDYLDKSGEEATKAPAQILKQLKVDLIFVIDTTKSMKPYIDATLDVVRNVSKNLTEYPDVASAVRLGLWGYRDSVKHIPKIGYTTKNYTPQLQTVEDFPAVLSQMQVTPVDSLDWNEDVFSGISDALANTQWSENSIRIIVLMGDAAGHEPGHPRNLSGHSPETLRSIASDSSVYLFALHIKPEKAVQHQAPAEEHFRALSANPGADQPAYVGVMSSDMEGFKSATNEITVAVVRLVVAAQEAAAKAEKEAQAAAAQKTGPKSEGPADAPAGGTGPAGTGGSEGGELAGTGLATGGGDKGELAGTGLATGGGDKGELAGTGLATDGGDKGELAGTGLATGGGDKGELAGTGLATGGGEKGELADLLKSGDPFADKSQTTQGSGTVDLSGQLKPQPGAGGGEGGEMAGTGLDDKAPVEEKARARANQVIRAALVQWIGSQTKASPPTDIVAWAIDKDLINPAVSSLEVRLLVNKRQLDSMRSVLNEVMAAGLRGQVDGDDFFNALQATSAVAARDPDRIKNAKIMAQTGLIPEFLMNLPYHSRLMQMNNDLWASWSVDEQDEFLNELKAKIEAYEDIHDRPGGWVMLNKGDDPDEHVYPVSLELLP